MNPPPAPPRRVRHGRLWAGLALAVIALCAAGVAANDTVYVFTEKLGTATVRYCVAQSSPRGRNTYTCVGDFVADDGSLRVAGVRFPENIRLDAGDRERVTVAGPGATEAHTYGLLHIAVFFGVAAAAVAGLVALLLRWRLAGRRR